MGYIFACNRLTRRRVWASLGRFVHARSRQTLSPDALYEWWKDLTEVRDPEYAYIEREHRIRLLCAIQVLAPHLYELIERDVDDDLLKLVAKVGIVPVKKKDCPRNGGLFFFPKNREVTTLFLIRLDLKGLIVFDSPLKRSKIDMKLCIGHVTLDKKFIFVYNLVIRNLV